MTEGQGSRVVDCRGAAGILAGRDDGVAHPAGGICRAG